MKKYCIFIALALCATLAPSCGNRSAKSGKSDGSETKMTRKEVTEAEIKLSEEMLATLDSLSVEYEKYVESSPMDLVVSSLTEEQKLVKPDYLLEPSQLKYLNSTRHKVNALAILMTERPIRKAYGMPVEPIDNAIKKLFLEVNFPISFADEMELPISEKFKKAYEICKERDEICFLWYYLGSIQNNLMFLISMNSDAFFEKLTPEQYEMFRNRVFTTRKAVKELAEYDPALASLLAFMNEGWDFKSIEEAEAATRDMESGKKVFEKRKENYRAYRDLALE